MTQCLINQNACGRVAGNPVCPKCGMDERVVYPGQADREAAQAAALARYEASEKAANQAPEPLKPTPSPAAQTAASPQAPSQAPTLPDPLASASTVQGKWGFKWFGIGGLVLVLVGGGAWWMAGHNGAAVEQERPVAALAPHEPRMVRIPGGTFIMGSSDSERAQVVSEGVTADGVKGERPQRSVTLKAFELAPTEVTRAQYAAFVRDTGHSSSGGCYHLAGGQWQLDANRNWQSPGFAQAEDHPVTCVSWNDALAYISWLNRQTGKRYRLPSEAEWEYAARAGNQTRFSWGEDKAYSAMCRYANGADASVQRALGGGMAAHCDDGFVYTSPVARFAANPWGLHDMHGNVREWVQDCYEDGYNKGQAADGSAHRAADSSCSRRVLRGGSWGYFPQGLRSAHRDSESPANRLELYGFRLARTVS